MESVTFGTFRHLLRPKTMNAPEPTPTTLHEPKPEAIVNEANGDAEDDDEDDEPGVDGSAANGQPITLLGWLALIS